MAVRRTEACSDSTPPLQSSGDDFCVILTIATGTTLSAHPQDLDCTPSIICPRGRGKRACQTGVEFRDGVRVERVFGRGLEPSTGMGVGQEQASSEATCRISCKSDIYTTIQNYSNKVVMRYFYAWESPHREALC